LRLAELSGPGWFITNIREMATSLKEKTTKKKSKMFQPQWS
jgi:hypothetical protein